MNFIDSSNNCVVSSSTKFTFNGERIYRTFLIAGGGKGYLMWEDGAVMVWFGEGEKFPTCGAAIEAVATGTI